MTIDELLAAAGLTANDEIPLWDAEATGESTKKITAQNLAAAVVALANLVTGVKGDAESSYRQGNVSLTPANIGAVDADALTIKPWGVNGESILANNGIYARSYNTNILPSQGVPTGFSEYASGLSVIGQVYPIAAYIDVFGNLAIWNSNQNRWSVYRKDGYVYGIAEGGTGATTPEGARTNLGILYADIFIPVDATEYITDLSGVNSQIISVLHINPINSVCTIKGAQVVNGVWKVFCDAVKVGTAQVRILYVTV